MKHLSVCRGKSQGLKLNLNRVFSKVDDLFHIIEMDVKEHSRKAEESDNLVGVYIRGLKQFGPIVLMGWTEFIK